MTLTTEAPTGRPGGTTQARRDVAIGAALVLVAPVLVVLPVPVLMRLLVVLPVLPVLVLLPGHLLTVLLLGSRPARQTPIDSTENGTGADPLVRGLLTVVLGILWLLLSVLVVAVVGARISATSCAVALAIGSSLLLIATWWTARRGAARPDGSTGPAVRPALFPTSCDSRAVRSAAGILAGALVLVGALIGARAMQPLDIERYTVIAFDDPRMLQAAPLESAAAATVILPWTLRSFGEDLADTTPTTAVTVGGERAADLVTRVDAVRTADGSGSTNEQSASVSFKAPRQSGLYEVLVSVVGAGETYLLTVHLQVTS
ncbi:hypothetical protein ABIB25_003444 [Nakamurella sp. UYEF19]|uniref:hypothetical protein n=1 Tax=Nakamurella sp. UYEF19 TaxID=1756392 RepID=UPI003391A184